MSLTPLARLALALFGLAGLSLAARPASATVTILSGGDAGEGFAPRSDIYFSLAAYFSGSPVQNVTFDTNGSAFYSQGAIYGTSGGSGTYFPIVTTNDVNLDAILSHGAFSYQLYGDGPIRLVVTGLTVGKTYQVDSLISSIGVGPGSRIESVTATGATTQFDTATVLAGTTTVNGAALDYQQLLTPDSNGQILLSYSSPDSGFPLLSGLILSSGSPASPAPEPSQVATLTLIGLGLGGLALRARRRLGGVAA